MTIYNLSAWIWSHFLNSLAYFILFIIPVSKTVACLVSVRFSSYHRSFAKTSDITNWLCSETSGLAYLGPADFCIEYEALTVVKTKGKKERLKVIFYPLFPGSSKVHFDLWTSTNWNSTKFYPALAVRLHQVIPLCGCLPLLPILWFCENICLARISKSAHLYAAIQNSVEF